MTLGLLHVLDKSSDDHRVTGLLASRKLDMYATALFLNAGQQLATAADNAVVVLVGNFNLNGGDVAL